MPIISIPDVERLSWFLEQVPTWVIKTSAGFTFETLFPLHARMAIRERFGPAVGLGVARHSDLRAALPDFEPFSYNELAVIHRGSVVAHLVDEQPNQADLWSELLAAAMKAPTPKSVTERTARRLDRLLAAVEEAVEAASCAASDQSVESPHAVLGLRADATRGEVEAAYRKLAKAYHPDLTARLGIKLREFAEREMTRINAAREAMLPVSTKR